MEKSEPGAHWISIWRSFASPISGVQRLCSFRRRVPTRQGIAGSSQIILTGSWTAKQMPCSSSEQPPAREIVRKIMSSDIVYVGGGNTLLMMRIWRRFGLDKVLKGAYEAGIVLAGISAGSICWFDSGHSDSMSFYNPPHENTSMSRD